VTWLEDVTWTPQGYQTSEHMEENTGERDGKVEDDLERNTEG